MNTSSLPVLFIGHGSPLNALADNAYTRVLNKIGHDLPKPRAILCVSAHWMTEGTWITAMEAPKTIHDFYGFPQALFEVQYPAPGDPELARKIAAEVPSIHLDREMWGLDHGAWAVLKHVYPGANIPVLQLSLHLEAPPSYHYELGKKLRFLREEGVLIVGSGNVVHNLRRMDWSETAAPAAWAQEFGQWVKGRLETRDDLALVNDPLKCDAGRLSVPTWEHYLPLLYALGAASGEKVSYLFEGIHHAAIDMLSLRMG